MADLACRGHRRGKTCPRRHCCERHALLQRNPAALVGVALVGNKRGCYDGTQYVHFVPTKAYTFRVDLLRRELAMIRVDAELAAIRMSRPLKTSGKRE